jgi:formamidopyrimidine-DNA glycosylase
MPEHPECLTIADQISAHFKGRYIEDFQFVGYGRHLKTIKDTDFPALSSEEIDDRQTIEHLPDFKDSFPLQITDVYSKGKLIVIEIGNWTIISTLGMTGHWGLNKIKHSHICIKLRVDDPDHFPFCMSDLYFSDTRRFGTIKILKSKKELQMKLDTIGKGFIGRWIISKEEFVSNLEKCGGKSGKSITEDLRDDQKSVCSGVGNYLISEILYDSSIDPFKKSSDLGLEEKEKLYESCKKIIKLSYRQRGFSLQDYKDFNGNNGGYKSMIYGRDGRKGTKKGTDKGEKVISVSGPGKNDKNGNGRTVWIVKKE